MYLMFFTENADLDAVMLQDRTASLTYAQAEDFCKELSVHLTARSVIFILCTNSIGSVLGYLASISNKTVPVLLSASIDKNLFKRLYDLYDPQYLWMPKDLHKDCVIESYFESYGYKLIKTEFKDYPIDKDLALLMSTSGSTGSPKLVRLSYKNLISNAQAISSYLKITSIERAITSLPMNYSYGLSVINSHLIKGA